MSTSLQQYFARSTQKALDDLVAAFLNLPEDKRAWSAMGDARTALDQMAECAILNGGTADMIRTKSFDPNFSMEEFGRQKRELAQDWDTLKARLEANTARAIEAIRDAPDADLECQVSLPWGEMTISQIMSYPFWNMCYHEGQINYIASMLGCLK
jgi:uncharacterized damage-inducible protein DinB